MYRTGNIALITILVILSLAGVGYAQTTFVSPGAEAGKALAERTAREAREREAKRQALEGERIDRERLALEKRRLDILEEQSALLEARQDDATSSAQPLTQAQVDDLAQKLRDIGASDDNIAKLLVKLGLETPLSVAKTFPIGLPCSDYTAGTNKTENSQSCSCVSS